MKDEEVLGECLAGAMYVEDFRRLCLKTGFWELRLLNSVWKTVFKITVFK